MSKSAEVSEKNHRSWAKSHTALVGLYLSIALFMLGGAGLLESATAIGVLALALFGIVVSATLYSVWRINGAD